MKLNIVFTLITLFSFTKAFGQEKIWTKQTKISEVIASEKKINPKVEFLSQNVSLSKDYYPLADKYKVTNPVIVKREPLEYLPIYAEYFYTPSYSVLRLVSYDWEKGRYDNFFDKQKMWREEGSKFETYNKEYERIKKYYLSNSEYQRPLMNQQRQSAHKAVTILIEIHYGKLKMSMQNLI